MIYALLGICSDPRDKGFITVDYTKKPQEVVQDAASFLFDVSNCDNYGSAAELMQNAKSLNAECLMRKFNSNNAVGLSDFLRLRGGEVEVTEAVVKAAAANRCSGEEMMQILLNQRPSEVTATEKVLIAAAANVDSGEQVLRLLLLKRPNEVKITEEVLKAAVANKGSGEKVIQLLLNELPGDEQTIKEIVEVLRWHPRENSASGKMSTGEPIRLIRASDLKMEYFDRSMSLPSYNILSHMWVTSNDPAKKPYEVSFQAYRTAWIKSLPGYKPLPDQPQSEEEGSAYRIGRAGEEIRWDNLLDPMKHGVSKKTGWGKIAWACWMTENATGPLKASHVWIDTCCIDKTNAREVSGAIASMAKWYAEAKTCYVYLQDMSVLKEERNATKGPAYERYNDEDHCHVRRQFKDSRWFSRGWTLQELLAPSIVHFYDHEWRFIGSKNQRIEDIHAATGIAREFFKGKAYQKACVATKMSWMAHRYTSLVEDMAYALLGILGVQMHAHYGAGANEFIRMQEALIQQGDTDESVFVWTIPTLEDIGNTTDAKIANDANDIVKRYGLLAPWPSCFAGNRKWKHSVSSSVFMARGWAGRKSSQQEKSKPKDKI
ncbi:hypothetical protein N0V90_008655 [Kalmusia sp. IMI 367209]|nr:hypothetical protein N0V90_008655 [Kalmusia sp. IMI 367209]